MDRSWHGVRTSLVLTNVPASAATPSPSRAGTFHSLAIRNDGTVMAWGYHATATNLPANLTNVVAISAGSSHSLALKSDGTVVAWGDDSDGQTNVPPGLNNVVAIAAGGYSSLALKNDGSIVAWGYNSSGQTSVPAGLTNAVAIAAGYLHSLALTPQSISSLINPVVLGITNGVPKTNNIFASGIVFYRVNVPANADFATNSLLYTLNGPLNVWFTTNTPPTIANVNAFAAVSPATNGVSILSTTNVPTNIVPGSMYYLGVQNTNTFAVSYGIEVNFHLVTPPPIVISSIIYTIIAGTNGFLLTWFAPSNDLFQVQWSGGLPPTWTTFTNIVSYNTNYPASATNAEFTFFDDGSQSPFAPDAFLPADPTGFAFEREQRRAADGGCRARQHRVLFHHRAVERGCRHEHTRLVHRTGEPALQPDQPADRHERRRCPLCWRIRPAEFPF